MNEHTKTLSPVKSCKQCGSAMRGGRGELTFTRDGLVITLKDVPMSICETCGERYVPGPVGVKVSALVDNIVRDLSERIKPQGVAVARALEFEATRELQDLCAV